MNETELLPLPRAEISTPFGAALVTVHSPDEIEVEVKRRVKINHILVSINVRSLLDIDGHWVHITRVTRWIKRDGVWQQGHKATENAYEKVKATFLPVIDAWIAANPDMFSAAGVINDKNLIRAARNRVSELMSAAIRIGGRIDEISGRYERTRMMTNEDRYALRVYGEEWALP